MTHLAHLVPALLPLARVALTAAGLVALMHANGTNHTDTNKGGGKTK